MVQKNSAAEYIPNTASLDKLKKAARLCHGCHLYKQATQTVFGAGNKQASLMLVGEQPGNKEDLMGKPFVGPAGRLLHKTLTELEIDEDLIYFTNSIKHFKFEMKGKIRQHRSPVTYEINACKPWLLAELKIIRPRVILCLGATSAKELIDPHFHLQKSRGILTHKPHYRVIATYHPSAILRAKLFNNDKTLLTYFKQDLQLAYQESQEA